MAAEGERGPDFVGSFEKGLRVMRAFGPETPAMTLSEVAERTDLTRAGARRLLHTLVSLGYARLDGKLFSLTPKVLDLGFAYLSSLRLPEVLHPILERVSKTLDESSSASVLDGSDIVYIARVQTRRIMNVALGVGARLPASHTSMGRVLLAFGADEAREQSIAALSAPPRATPNTTTSKKRFRDLLKAVRNQGYCLVDQELEAGLRAIAVPIFDRQGSVVAAMNASGQSLRVEVAEMKSRYLPVLQQAAREAREALL